MAIGDWFLARSEAFRLLMGKIRDHKQDTIEAFQKVKLKHKKIETVLIDHDKEIKALHKSINELEEIMNATRELPAEGIIRIKKKKQNL